MIALHVPAPQRCVCTVTLDPCLLPFTKTKSKYVRDLGIRTETLNLLEYKTCQALEETTMGTNFLNRIPVVHEITTVIRNEVISSFKRLQVTAKVIVSRVATTYRMGKKHLSCYSSDAGVVSRIYKEL